MKLTAAQHRALEAVRDGRIMREYNRDGNVFRCPGGIGAQSVWRLEQLKLIRNSDGPRGGIVIRLEMELTDAGRRYLWENPS